MLCPQKGIDDVIASQIAGWNPYRVATLRGMYDELHETKPLDVTNLQEAAKKLVEFRKNQMQDRATKMKTAVTTASKDYLKLSEDFEGEILSDRINMISHIFSNILDSIEASYITNRTDGSPILTRQMIVNGFTNTSGQLIGGQFAIFESIYNMLMERYEKLIAANQLEMASKYKKIFNNWPALVLRVRVNLREIEGIKLGNKWEYAVNADPEAFEEEALTESYFAEEATRESWMEKI